MSKIIAGLYSEPVLFTGVVTTVLSALSAAGEIPVWIGPAAVAVGAVITRHFVSPAEDDPGVVLELPGHDRVGEDDAA